MGQASGVVVKQSPERQQLWNLLEDEPGLLSPGRGDAPWMPPAVLPSSILYVGIGANPTLYCEAIELVCGGSPKVCVLVERKALDRVKSEL
jgi:hypothetical protein